MTSLFRQFIIALFAIALAAFGVYHAVTSYPDANAFALVSRELPTIGAVASFYFGVALALIGVVLLIPVAVRLRRSQRRKIPVYAVPGAFRPAPDRREEDWDVDPDADPYGFDPEADEYERGRHRGYDMQPPSRNGRALAGGRR